MFAYKSNGYFRPFTANQQIIQNLFIRSPTVLLRSYCPLLHHSQIQERHTWKYDVYTLGKGRLIQDTETIEPFELSML